MTSLTITSIYLVKLCAFEDKFGVTIADEDLGTLKTVGDIFNYLAARAA